MLDTVSGMLKMYTICQMEALSVKCAEYGNPHGTTNTLVTSIIENLSVAEKFSSNHATI